MQRHGVLAIGMVWVLCGCCSAPSWKSANEAVVIVHVPRISAAVVRTLDDSVYVGRIKRCFDGLPMAAVINDARPPVYEIFLCATRGNSYRFTSVDGKIWKYGNMQYTSREDFADIWRDFVKRGIQAAHTVFDPEPINKESYWTSMIDLQRLVYSDAVLARAWNCGELKKGFWKIDELSSRLERW